MGPRRRERAPSTTGVFIPEFDVGLASGRLEMAIYCRRTTDCIALLTPEVVFTALLKHVLHLTRFTRTRARD